MREQMASQSKTRKLLPKLRKISKEGKKYHYRIKDPREKRILAINEGVRHEMKYKNKTQKQAAIAKKGRFNILRIYRRNNNVKDCNIITRDMRYMDKKYKLGETKNICGKTKKNQKGGNRKTKKRRKYVTIDKEILTNIDRHITNSIDTYTDFKPSNGFKDFIECNSESIMPSLERTGLNKHDIDDKLKKTYKNRYFILKNKSG